MPARRWTKHDPSEACLAELASCALARYREAAAANPNPLQNYVWGSGNFHLFVEQAAPEVPWHVSRRTVNIVNGIMVQLVLKEREMPEAIAAARRVASRPLNTGLD